LVNYKNENMLLMPLDYEDNKHFEFKGGNVEILDDQKVGARQN
jgi:hypothetical protein